MKTVLFILLPLITTYDSLEQFSTHYLNEEAGSDLKSISHSIQYLKRPLRQVPFSETDSEARTTKISEEFPKLLQDSPAAEKAYANLNWAADSNYGKTFLKENKGMKGVLNILAKTPSMKIANRELAGRLMTKLTDVPAVFQNPNDKGKSFGDISSHIFLPNIQRTFERDLYVEKMKAGNWRPDLY